jgi:hypothetical protein
MSRTILGFSENKLICILLKLVLDNFPIFEYNTYMEIGNSNDKYRRSIMPVPNYTALQMAEIKERAPLNYEIASELGTKFGKKTRSVIAKAISMEVEYIAKPRHTKNGETVERKLAIVNDIEKMLKTTAPSLVKATKADLVRVREVLMN